MALNETQFCDVVVVLHHPHADHDIEITLSDWMEHGPGPRELLRPVAAKRKSTGEALPLSAIPVQYRNNRVSRFLISVGLLANPWEK